MRWANNNLQCTNLNSVCHSFALLLMIVHTVESLVFDIGNYAGDHCICTTEIIRFGDH